MAVQKNKPSRAKKGMRRSHDKCCIMSLSIDKVSNENHIRHNMTKKGFYRGKKHYICKK